MILGICQLLGASYWLFPTPLSPLICLTMYGAQCRPSGAAENQPTNDTNTNPYQFSSPGHDSNPSPYQFPPPLLTPGTPLLNAGGHPLPQVDEFFSRPPQAEAVKLPAQEYQTPSHNIMHPPSVTQNLVTVVSGRDSIPGTQLTHSVLRQQVLWVSCTLSGTWRRLWSAFGSCTSSAPYDAAPRLQSRTSVS